AHQFPRKGMPAIKNSLSYRAPILTSRGCRVIPFLESLDGTDQMPMDREPGQEDAGRCDQRKLQLGNEPDVGAQPSAQSRESSEAAEKDCHARNQVHHDKIFVEGMRRQRRLILQTRY